MFGDSNGQIKLRTKQKFKFLLQASPLDCLVSYQRHSSGESYPSAEMQSVYSETPADWTIPIFCDERPSAKVGDKNAQGVNRSLAKEFSALKRSLYFLISLIDLKSQC